MSDNTTDDLLAHVQQLRDQLQIAGDIVADSNSACACGCPVSEHDNYGEDGLACDHPEHECIPTSRAVAATLHGLRGQLQTAQNRIKELEEK